MEHNEKVKSSKGYEIRARKYNLKTMASSVYELRNMGIKTREELEEHIKENATKRQEIQSEMKKLEHEIENLKRDMENVKTIQDLRDTYIYSKNNPDDKAFAEEYRPQITIYTSAAKEILKRYEASQNQENSP